MSDDGMKRPAPEAASTAITNKKTRAEIPRADFRVEPKLGRVPRFSSRKPAVKLSDTFTGFKKKQSLRENAAIALANVESGRWTVSNLHNSVNALYAAFHTGCGVTAKRPFDPVQTDAVSSLKACVEQITSHDTLTYPRLSRRPPPPNPHAPPP